ncbi:hypothetical protein FWF89_00525 [Candidatus Saccharibacteria bacterium]|nr:hypothetical protein [Candidatus Saccharibacteria bacterium]
MTYKEKFDRVMGVSGWNRGKIARLLGVNYFTVRRWTKTKAKPRSAYAEKIDLMYDGIVKPLECEIDRLSDIVEKRILKEQIKDLKKDDCEV